MAVPDHRVPRSAGADEVPIVLIGATGRHLEAIAWGAVQEGCTGYSSLPHIRQLPLACLKIDRSFVSGLDSDPQSKVLTKGVIGMAHGLNLITVAEGVETQAQLRWLIEQDCDVAQGYLFSRPVPAEAVALAIVAIESAIRSESQSAPCSSAGATIQPATPNPE